MYVVYSLCACIYMYVCVTDEIGPRGDGDEREGVVIKVTVQ